MGWSVHLQSFQGKAIVNFPRVIVWNVFAPKAHSANWGWTLMYDDGYGGLLYLKDDPLVDGCSVERPSSDAIRDMFMIAQRVPSAISTDANFFVTDAAFVSGMPDWLLNALPYPPRTVASADELLERLAGR